MQSDFNRQENHVKQALNSTNTSSLAELGMRIEKLQETKQSLVKSESEIERRLERQAEKTAQLNKALDEILVEKQVKDTTQSRGLYELEEQLIEKVRGNEALRVRTEFLKTQAASIMLSINRLLQNTSDGEESLQWTRVVHILERLRVRFL